MDTDNHNESINSADENKRYLKALFKPLCVVTAILAALIIVTAVMFGQKSFAIAVAITVPIGFVVLIIQSLDIMRFMSGKVSVPFVIRFIFMLACLGVLLYTAVDTAKLSPLGVGIGLTIPIFSALITVALKEIKEF